jgi:hypothetical protein
VRVHEAVTDAFMKVIAQGRTGWLPARRVIAALHFRLSRAAPPQRCRPPRSRPSPGEYPVVPEPDAAALLDFLGGLAFSLSTATGVRCRAAWASVAVGDQPRGLGRLARTLRVRRRGRPKMVAADQAASPTVVTTRSRARGHEVDRTRTWRAGAALRRGADEPGAHRRRRGREAELMVPIERGLWSRAVVRQHGPREADAADRHDAMGRSSSRTGASGARSGVRHRLGPAPAEPRRRRRPPSASRRGRLPMDRARACTRSRARAGDFRHGQTV